MLLPPRKTGADVEAVKRAQHRPPPGPSHHQPHKDARESSSVGGECGSLGTRETYVHGGARDEPAPVRVRESPATQVDRRASVVEQL